MSTTPLIVMVIACIVHMQARNPWWFGTPAPTRSQHHAMLSESVCVCVCECTMTQPFVRGFNCAQPLHEDQQRVRRGLALHRMQRGCQGLLIAHLHCSTQQVHTNSPSTALHSRPLTLTPHKHTNEPNSLSGVVQFSRCTKQKIVGT